MAQRTQCDPKGVCRLLLTKGSGAFYVLADKNPTQKRKKIRLSVSVLTFIRTSGLERQRQCPAGPTSRLAAATAELGHCKELCAALTWHVFVRLCVAFTVCRMVPALLDRSVI